MWPNTGQKRKKKKTKKNKKLTTFITNSEWGVESQILEYFCPEEIPDTARTSKSMLGKLDYYDRG